MRSVDEIADLSVARGCGFASLAIFTFMIGLADQLSLSFAAGGIFTLCMALVLIVKAWAATHTAHRRTEVWLMMRAEEKPPDGQAQLIIGAALRQAYLRFATHSAFAAFGMLAASMVLRFTR